MYVGRDEKGRFCNAKKALIIECKDDIRYYREMYKMYRTAFYREAWLAAAKDLFELRNS